VSANSNEENRTVKRTAIILAGVATLGFAAYLGSYLRAQTATVPPPKTKIGVINLSQVVKGYTKWADFEKNYKNYLEQAKAEFDKLKGPAVELKDRLAKMAPDAPDREKVQQELRNTERRLQDFDDDVKKKLAQWEDKVLVQIYQEIHDAVESYARSNDIEMVMHFNDAIAQAELYHPFNVKRKMQTQGTMPIYVTPGMDITKIITDNLNYRLRASAAPTGNP
jgi:Skp family chaperone for outer membrane proteins